MSGICGILRLDGGPPEGIEAMAERLERRGPEGTHIFRDGPCALGHTLLATTPEALVERQPFTHTETGCTITADLRLDNRDDLMPVLRLAGQGRVIGDAEIVLHAYLQWGEDCPKHLLGDFAFAIWDPRYRRLFCARDHMGMKQLIHAHVERGVFAFSSEPSAVLMAAGVPRRISEGRVADFLEGNLEDIDLTSTFYCGVKRLPPAHTIVVTQSTVQRARYWQLEPGKRHRFRSEAEAGEALLATLDVAVRRRLRAPEGRVGGMLSGGIDSSSVIALAARACAETGGTPFPSYSVIGPDPANCIETRTIQMSQSCLRIAPVSIDWSDLGDLKAPLVASALDLDDAFDAYMNLPRAVFLAAAREGRSVVLDGGAGDVVFGVPRHLTQLILSGRWVTAWSHIRGEAAYYGNGWTERHILRMALVEGLPVGLRLRLRELRRRLRGEPRYDILSENLADRVNYPERERRMFEATKYAAREVGRNRAKAIAGTSMIVGRERYDRVAAQFGVEPRDPFLDKDVAAFALGCETNLLENQGIRKWLLRRAMKDLLPAEVCFRKGKEHLGRLVTAQLMDEIRLGFHSGQPNTTSNQQQKFATNWFRAGQPRVSSDIPISEKGMFLKTSLNLVGSANDDQ